MNAHSGYSTHTLPKPQPACVSVQTTTKVFVLISEFQWIFIWVRRIDEKRNKQTVRHSKQFLWQINYCVADAVTAVAAVIESIAGHCTKTHNKLSKFNFSLFSPPPCRTHTSYRPSSRYYSTAQSIFISKIKSNVRHSTIPNGLVDIENVIRTVCFSIHYSITIAVTRRKSVIKQFISLIPFYLCCVGPFGDIFSVLCGMVTTVNGLYIDRIYFHSYSSLFQLTHKLRFARPKIQRDFGRVQTFKWKPDEMKVERIRIERKERTTCKWTIYGVWMKSKFVNLTLG